MFEYEVDEEITLRLIQKQDTVALFQLTDASREYLQEWLPWVRMTKNKSDSLEYIERAEQAYESKKGMHYGIFYNEELVGMVSMNRFDWTNKIGYIGYWLGEKHQGKGIMTIAVSALIDYGFFTLNLHRIDIRAALDNDKSRKIPERLGFQQEGILRQTEWIHDHYVDHAVYGMLATEWE